MNFWKDHNLYDGLLPINDSVRVLRSLKERGHEIVFVSAAKGWHQRSKYYWIDKFFPFKDGVLLTKEKHYTNVDVMIDDNPDVLSKMNTGVLTIQIDNGCENVSEFTPHHFCKNWKEIEEILCKC
jgi:5'(3')-deoxyribonucleotidase